MGLLLRDLAPDDYAALFENMHDPVASRMAAFGTRDPDVATFAARLQRGIDAGATITRAIVEDGAVVGFVAAFAHDGERHVTYWIARRAWGRGIATAALREFLALVPERPLHASTASDNAGSMRVLTKCGFVRCGEAPAFANARGEPVTEVFFVLR